MNTTGDDGKTYGKQLLFLLWQSQNNLECCEYVFENRHGEI